MSTLLPYITQAFSVLINNTNITSHSFQKTAFRFPICVTGFNHSSVISGVAMFYLIIISFWLETFDGVIFFLYSRRSTRRGTRIGRSIYYNLFFLLAFDFLFAIFFLNCRFFTSNWFNETNVSFIIPHLVFFDAEFSQQKGNCPNSWPLVVIFIQISMKMNFIF